MDPSFHPALSFPSSVARKRSESAPPRVIRVNTVDLRSGLHVTGPKRRASSSRTCFSPPPSARFHDRENFAPGSSVANETYLPSGVHSGYILLGLPNVRRVITSRL